MPGGRPDTYPQRQAEIGQALERIRKGVAECHAVVASGIPADTWNEWKRRGNPHAEELTQKVNVARAVGCCELVESLNGMGDDDHVQLKWKMHLLSCWSPEHRVVKHVNLNARVRTLSEIAEAELSQEGEEEEPGDDS